MGGSREAAPRVGEGSRKVALSVVAAPAVTVVAGPRQRNIQNEKGINYFSKVSVWIMDTGAGMDIVGNKDVPNKKSLIKPDVNVMFNTANGLIEGGSMCPGIVKPLGEGIAPFVLPNSPALLTVGRRCLEKGYGFYWFPYKRPFLVTPKARLYLWKS